MAHLSAIQAFVLGFCSSGYDFAIASSRPHLTMRTLQVAIGFAGNCAPCGLSPQTNGMPVIPKKRERTLSVDAPRVSHKYNYRFVFLRFYANLCTVPYSASFRSPSLTQPALRRKRLISGQMTAGRMTATKANPIQSTVVIPVLKPEAMSLTQPV